MNNGCETAITRTGKIMGNLCESAVKRTRWGLCNFFLVALCGFCTLAEAVASLIVLVVTPLLACDFKFGKNDVTIINAVSSLGMAFGGFLFGTLADTNGRKSSIPITMVVIFCASIGISFVQKFFPIILAVFLLGVGVAGNNVTLRVYLIECLPAKRRGSCLAMLDLLWIVGYLVALGISWSLVPSIVRMLGKEFRPSSWRVLAGLGGGPSLIMACAASLLPPSPRYLLYRQHPEQALTVLQQMYAINNSRHTDHYPPCELEGSIRADESEDTGARSVLKIMRKFVTKTWMRIKIICSPPFTRVTAFLIISRICLFPGFIWLAMWKAHLFLQENIASEKSLMLHEVNNSSVCAVDSGDVAQAFLHNCHQANHARFEYPLLLSTSYILGEGLLVFGIDIVGRRLSIVTSGLVGGTSMIALAFATHTTAPVVLSVLSLAAYSVLYTTTGIILMENYPTSVRGTVVGLISVLPHLAGFFVKFFARMYCTLSIYVATGLIIGATLAALPIPDLTGAPMHE